MAKGFNKLTPPDENKRRPLFTAEAAFHAAARIERELEIVEPNSTKTLRYFEGTTHANA
jgi:hypothetical protein